jgi:hypothetical protein
MNEPITSMDRLWYEDGFGHLWGADLVDGKLTPTGKMRRELDNEQIAAFAAFAAGLKAHLRHDPGQMIATHEGDVDWDGIDAAIDAFAAEFQKRER